MTLNKIKQGNMPPSPKDPRPVYAEDINNLIGNINVKEQEELTQLITIYKKLAGEKIDLAEKKAISKFGLLRQIAQLPLQQINHVFDFNGNFESLPMNGYPINFLEIYPKGKIIFTLKGTTAGFDGSSTVSLAIDTGSIADVQPIIDSRGAENVKRIILTGLVTSLEVINNVNLLTHLEDLNTQQAFIISGHKMSKEAIDNLFTQLPDTTRTATIVVSGNPGAATCDPSIATAKGYTVITS